MAANTTPIFPLGQNVSWSALTAGTSYRDGTVGTTLLFTAGANGARIDQIKVRTLGAVSTASVVRFYVNNGATTATATNNSLIHEVSIGTTTAGDTYAAGDIDVLISKGTDVVVPIPYLPSSYTIRASLGTTISAGVQITVHGANY
jgi:ABC-type dipeptide/oligopeptide/nickel transport system permease subunit